MTSSDDTNSNISSKYLEVEPHVEKTTNYNSSKINQSLSEGDSGAVLYYQKK